MTKKTTSVNAMLKLLTVAAAFSIQSTPNAFASSPSYLYTSCSIDSDSDGLVDCYETNTNSFVSTTDTGTDPAIADTDGDGLSDGDEVNGTSGGLNLPEFGVNPLHKDILLEYDWMDDATDCSFHSHKPTQAMLDIVREAFADAPIENPDGVTGIHVFQELASQWDSESNYIYDDDGIVDGVFSPEYVGYEAQNFSSNRIGYFHYVIFAHEYTNGPSGSSGQASIGGYKMLITLYCGFANTTHVAYTIVHELGHNLGLLHGGDQSCNRKPNYNSVMNYSYQFSGVRDCALQPIGRADYSKGDRILLDESHVYEPDGVCYPGWGGPTPIDWNHNQVIDYRVYSRDLGCTQTIEVLHDYNDWANIDLAGVRSISGQTTTCALVPAEMMGWQ